MITNGSKYRKLFSSSYLMIIVLVFQTSWFTWSHPIILAASLSQVFRHQSSIDVADPVRDTDKVVFVNHTQHQPVWSSMQWSPHDSSIQEARNKRDGEFN